MLPLRSPKDAAHSLRPRLGAFWTHLTALAGYSIVAIAFTWPMISMMTEEVIGFRDVWQNMWNLWWVKTALLDLHTNPYFTGYLFYPGGVPLYYHALAPLNGILSIPFQLLGGLPFAYDALVFLGYVLGGYGTFLLARRYVHPTPAFVAGLVFAFSPQHAVQTFGHLEQITHFWLPFYALAFLIAVEDPRWKTALVAALLLVLASLVTWYHAFALVVFSIIVTSRQTWQSWAQGARIGPPLRMTALVGVVYTSLIAPVLIPTLLEAQHAKYMVMSLQAAAEFSSDLLAFVTPGVLHPWWGQQMMAIQHHFTGYIGENVVFVGFVPLALTGIAVAKRPRQARHWLLIALVFAILALGPWLHINGSIVHILDRPLVLPYALLYRWVPFVKVIRTPSRISQMIMLAMGMLAALGVDEIMANFRGPGRKRLLRLSIPLLAGGLILFEFWPTPLPMRRPPTTPPFVRYIASQTQPGAVLDVPLTYEGLHAYMYYQTMHRRPIAGGYLSRLIEDPLQSVASLRQLAHLDPSDRAGIVESPASPLDAAAALGFRFVVLHKNRFPPDQRATLPARIEAILGSVTPAYQDQNAVVYALATPLCPTAIPLLGERDGWYKTETDRNRPFRWMRSPAVIRIIASAPMEIRLAFTPHAVIQPSTLEIYTEREHIGTYRVIPGETIVTSPFSLQPRENLVRFVVPEGNVIPMKIDPKRADARPLAIAFRRIQVIREAAGCGSEERTRP